MMTGVERSPTRIVARGYEIDANGHVAATVLMQYAQHARWSCLRAAGVDEQALLARGVGPVSLEERINFRRELLAGQEVDVTCRYRWTAGKTFRVEQEIHRSDGELIAEITNIGGLLDHARRRLVADPAQWLREAATNPGILGLDA